MNTARRAQTEVPPAAHCLVQCVTRPSMTVRVNRMRQQRVKVIVLGQRLIYVD